MSTIISQCKYLDILHDKTVKTGLLLYQFKANKASDETVPLPNLLHLITSIQSDANEIQALKAQKLENNVGHGGSVVSSVPWVQRVTGSNPATKGPRASPSLTDFAC